MSAAPEPTDAAVVESLLAFWADAGVDAMLLDEAVDRIEAGKVMPPVRPAPPTPAVAAVAVPRALGVQVDISAAVAQAQALAAAAPDLEALVAAIAAFEGCSLRFEGAATKAVVYRGDPKAPLLVIGEGPGADEDARGEPFVGRAGKLLDRMLAAAGLTDRVLITNTVFWRPPGNRTPTPAEQAICAPFLERIIQLVRPRMLLLAGGASAKSVLKREEGILSLRGRWFEWRSADGSIELPAMPTLHPAFLLRQPGAKKRAWSDLLTLTERLDRPDRPL
ncbi:MAG TPA: uracil-DNA glycosylase [Phenylobacterium sp.]|nr:uracil-DNA glycosylase [Phenylobacterium sp.]